MADDVEALLSRCGGVATRAQLLTASPRHRIDRALQTGRVLAVFPRTYVLPWLADDPEVLERAAVLSVGAGAVVSHLSALRRWHLPVPPCDQVHVVTSSRRHPRGVPERLVVHRVSLPVGAVRLAGTPTVRCATAIVSSWPLLSGADGRAPAIVAVRERRVGVSELRAGALLATRLARRAQLLRFVETLAAGCESELELWGYEHVFDVPGLRHARRQLVVAVAGRRYRLDMAFDDERVDVELDGRRYHAGDARWEQDIGRDVALATVGWQTVRFSHRRLTSDVAGCRREILAVLASRRRWPRTS